MCGLSLIDRLFKPRSRRHRFVSSDMTDADVSEKISLHTIEEAEDTPHEPQMPWREKLAEFLKTNKVQYVIIALVVLDSLIVVFEMLIDLEIIVIPENGQVETHVNATHHTNHTADWYEMGVYNETENHGHSRRMTRSTENHSEDKYVHITDTNAADNPVYINSSNDTRHHVLHHPHHHSNKEIVEHSLHYASLTILAIFVVEVICKIIAEGTHLLKHKAEVFDAIIVLVSFSMDIAFSFVSVTSAAKDAAGLMVLLRLWRITRIINGVIMSVKLDADKKINEQKIARAKAEEEVGRLKRQVDTLHSEMKILRDRLKQYESDGDVRRAPCGRIEVAADIQNCDDGT
ncbi:voltage-gated hydrogen channel 1-like [Haliotis cracherodii]|uniref:voltage-gated hydrogen channel 1-like n=1 Tax=Haliotis cracherodii TaxID=6455 RepID=UPI0039E86B33